MTTTTLTPIASAAWNDFDKTTSRWGRITMILALIAMVAGPLVLAIQLDVSVTAVLAGVAAIALIYAVLWFIEPLSYFPILGAASMYQAFMIGNISNKLLPAAIVAQNTIGAKPGTKRGQLAAVLAICGAAMTHLLSLLIFVGIFGTLLLKAIPADVTAQIQLFVLPAIMGGVLVQMFAGNPNYRVLAIALVVGGVIQLVLTPILPIFALFGVAFAVLATVLLALFLPGGKGKKSADDVVSAEDMS